MNSSLFLSKAADAADLAAWSSILPAQSRVLRTNLFGDVFLLDDAGAVHMLERAGCSIDRIAFSEEEFWRELRDDAHGWQLRGLVSECQSAGKLPKEDQCYAFTTPPILGGDYTVENVWVAPWRDWFAFTADLFEQIKDLPDGATVSLKVVD